MCGRYWAMEGEACCPRAPRAVHAPCTSFQASSGAGWSKQPSMSDPRAASSRCLETSPSACPESSRTSSFSCSSKRTRVETALSLGPVETLAPAMAKTLAIARRSARCKSSSSATEAGSTEAAALAVLSPFNCLTSSVTRGSTLGLSPISCPSPETPSSRTDGEASFRALTKVGWSWGTNVLSKGPPLPRRVMRVCKTAALTLLGNLSPRIRISGPVIFTRKGLRLAGSLRVATSPIPEAAISR
mmetsp:Transcript_2337/g.6806  ORF Transcript_2337/g.6806 Transcript_2337/m.6806 type:complete len:244 (+) Transcript_2337:625-1356(+)